MREHAIANPNRELVFILRTHERGDKDQYLQGPLFGGDGWGWTRDFVTKNPVFAGKLSIQKFWYIYKL